MKQFPPKAMLYLVGLGVAVVFFLFPWSIAGQSSTLAIVSDAGEVFNPGLQTNSDLSTLMQQTDAPISSPGSQPPLNIILNNLILAAPPHPSIIGISSASHQQRFSFAIADLPQINQSDFIVSSGASAELPIKFIQPPFEITTSSPEPTIAPTQTTEVIPPNDASQTITATTTNQPAATIQPTSTFSAPSPTPAPTTVITPEPADMNGVLNFIGLICGAVAIIVAALIGIWNKDSIKGFIEWIKRKQLPTSVNPNPQSKLPKTTTPKPINNGTSTIPPKNAEEIMNVDFVDLLEKLKFYFDEEELRTLCFKLNDVDYESLQGQGKAGKARGLIEHMKKQEKGIEKLIAALEKERPHVNWSKIG